MAMWSLVGLTAARRLVRSALPAPMECRILLRSVGGPKSDRVALVVSSRAAQPCALLWPAPKIVLPETLVADADPRTLRWALAHEWSHVERGDLTTWTASGIVRWFYFYQPLVWWLRGQLQLWQDFIADAAAASAGGMPEDYAEFLTASSLTRPTLAAGLGIGGRISDLRRRVIMLVDRRRPLESKSPRRWNLIAVPIAALVIAVTAGVGPRDDRPDAPQVEGPHAIKLLAANESKDIQAKKSEEPAAPTPNAARKIVPGDVLTIDVMDNLDSLEDLGLHGLRLLLHPGMTAAVDSEGRLSLGSRYGSIDVGGRSLREAELEIQWELSKTIQSKYRPARASESATERKTIADILEQIQLNVRLSFAPQDGEGTPILQAKSLHWLQQQRAAAGPKAPATIGGYKRPAASLPTASPVAPTLPDETIRGRIEPGDVLNIEADPPEANVRPVSVVESDGGLALGVRFGRVYVAGKTLSEAEKEVGNRVGQTFKSPSIQITFARAEAGDAAEAGRSGLTRVRELEREVEQLKATIRLLEARGGKAREPGQPAREPKPPVGPSESTPAQPEAPARPAEPDRVKPAIEPQPDGQ
jgi:protein involved in polysaccharide export with SLBB domain